MSGWSILYLSSTFFLFTTTSNLTTSNCSIYIKYNLQNKNVTNKKKIKKKLKTHKHFFCWLQLICNKIILSYVIRIIKRFSKNIIKILISFYNNYYY
jgi:hypothetical protein